MISRVVLAISQGFMLLEIRVDPIDVSRHAKLLNITASVPTSMTPVIIDYQAPACMPNVPPINPTRSLPRIGTPLPDARPCGTQR